MKIKESINSYNIESMSDIVSAVTKFRGHCEYMDELGAALKQNIEYAAENGYQDVNSKKAEEIIAEYRKNLSNCKDELDELNDSVKRYIDKMQDIWGIKWDV